MRDVPSADRDCCTPRADPRVARAFDRKWSGRTDDDDFPPLQDVSARLLDLLRDAPLVRPTVFEIGSGTGAAAVALLEMGARRLTGVDLSPESVDLARRRVAAAGFEDRTSFEVGHGGGVRPDPHDWVVIDRVLCCDGDPAAILRTAIAASPQRIAISVPESRGWRGLVNRPLWAAENVWDLAFGGCRGYVHDLRRIERQLTAAGFRRTTEAGAGLWFLAIYERESR